MPKLFRPIEGGCLFVRGRFILIEPSLAKSAIKKLKHAGIKVREGDEYNAEGQSKASLLLKKSADIDKIWKTLKSKSAKAKAVAKKAPKKKVASKTKRTK